MSKLSKYPHGGFTLIELLVVVLIIGILAAIALPQYRRVIEKSKATQAMAFIGTIKEAMREYYLIHNTYPTNLDDLDVNIPWTDNSQSFGYDIAADSPDYRTTDDWMFGIYKYIPKYGNGIRCIRNSGTYKGAGFMYFFDRDVGDTPLNQLTCVEDTYLGFTADAGSYCSKIMGWINFNNHPYIYISQ